MVNNTKIEDSGKIYKNCLVSNCCIGANSSIGDFSRVFDSKLNEHVAIQRFALMYNTSVGRYSYTGKNFTSWYSSIGNFCSISWNVSIGGANHDYTRVTTHAFLYSQDFGLLEDNDSAYDRFSDYCIVGNDVWIGCGATICRNVKIGDGAVIAAGSVVTKNVEPYTIVAGVPAKPIKKRFDNETIQMLIKSKWWDLPEYIIKKNINLFSKKADLDVARKIAILRNDL